MPPSSDNHDSYDYAERIRERLPRRLQELREAAGMSMYALWLKCGVSLEMLNQETPRSIRREHRPVL